MDKRSDYSAGLTVYIARMVESIKPLIVMIYHREKTFGEDQKTFLKAKQFAVGRCNGF